jgi:hypothetical protein
VPSQLPPARHGFVDRTEHGEWLTTMIPARSDDPTIIVLTGLPGVGKAAFVCWWAQQHPDQFPGGQFYADCADLSGEAAGAAATADTTADAGTVGGPGMGASPSDILATFLRSLNVSDAYMPAVGGERLALFRSLTAGAPVLIFLKNATHGPQVRGVLPNSRGSMVVVTTVGDLKEVERDGAVFHEMRHFDERNSTRLFSVICGADRLSAEPASASSLARLCAGMPIAIVALANQLARRQHLTLAQLVADLSPEDERLTALSVRGKVEVTHAFDACYNRLPEPARRLYRALGLLPMPEIGTWAVAAAMQVTPRVAARLLDELQSAGLLEERAPERYAFHELVRLHAKGVAHTDPGETDESREAVVHAVVREFLVRTAYADLAVMGKRRARATNYGVLLADQVDPFLVPDVVVLDRPAPDDEARDKARKAAADAWMDAERASMVPLVATAADRGWDAEAWQLAEALVGAYFFNHRPIGDWLAACALGVQAARRCGNDEAEARLRLAASRAHTDQGALDLAWADVDEAMRIAERGTDLVLQASAWEFRGRVLEAMAAAEAVSVREAAEAAEAAGGAVTETTAEALASMTADALAAYARSRELNVEADEWRGAALAGFFSARLLAQAQDPAPGQLEQALRELKESADAFRRLDDRRMTGRALIATGILENRLGRAREAATILEAAVSELGTAHYAGEALETLATIAERSGDRAGAQHYLSAAWRIYHDAKHPQAFEIAQLLDEAPE